jgi:hypothetical protein
MPEIMRIARWTWMEISKFGCYCLAWHYCSLTPAEGDNSRVRAGAMFLVEIRSVFGREICSIHQVFHGEGQSVQESFARCRVENACLTHRCVWIQIHEGMDIAVTFGYPVQTRPH